MPANKPALKPLICPACFAREIDPVMLNFDPDDGGEYYCTHCGYTAKSREQVNEFLLEFQRLRHGITLRH